MWNEQSIQRLSAAVRAFDCATAEAISADLIDHLDGGNDLAPDDAESVVRLLRANRYFEPLKRVISGLQAAWDPTHQRIDSLRRELCFERNQLDDHYEHVRAICGQPS